MAADFEVTVGADLSAYNAGLQRGVATAQTASTQITRSLATAAQASTAMGGAVARGSNQAAFALTNLGRVAQDAPFGFIGIQNNLNPLLESFQRLRAETGSNVGALRALGSAFMGAGGLGIALSIVTSAITFYTMWQQKAAHATKEAHVAASALSDVYKNANDDIAKQATNLKYLYESATDVNNAMDKRLQAARELQKEFPTTLGLQSKENIINGEASGIYQQLTKDIIANAMAKASANKIAEEEAKILNAQIQMAKVGAGNQQVNNKRRAEMEDRIKDAVTFEYKRRGLATEGIAFDKAVQTILDAQYKISNDKAAKQLNEQYSIAKQAQSNIDLIERVMGGGTAIGNGLASDPSGKGDKGKKSKEAKTFIQELQDRLGDLQDQEARWIAQGNTADWFNLTARERNINALVALIDKLKSAENGVKAPDIKLGSFMPKDIKTPLSINPQSEATLNRLSAYQKAAQAQFDLKNRSQEATEALKEQEQTVSSLTSAFGQGLTGAFQSALSGTQSFIQAMGQFLSQLITKLIAAAAAAAILAVILSAVGFGSGLSGAASSFGSFKNLFGSFSGVKLAEGGITTGPTRALIGEGREKEAVMPLSKLQAFVNGGNNSNRGGEFVNVFRGADLLVQQRRAEQQKQRIG